VAANIVLSLILFVPLKHVGIALATSLAGWLNCVLLAWSLKGANFLVLDKRCRSRLPRILLAAVVMGLGLWWLDGMVSAWFDAGFLQRLAALALLVAIGLLVFVGATLALGGMSLQELRGLLSRSKKTPPGGPSGSGGT
jgi:putative peptidoglycan lipid II flippase